MNQTKYRIGKVHISVTNPVDAQERIMQAALEGKGGYMCVSNMRMIRYAGEHADYAALMEKSMMNLPDGKPLSWLGRLWGIKGIVCTNGPELFKAMLGKGNSGLKHYLLGDTEDVIEQIKKLNGESFHADIVGAESLPFANVDEFDYDGIAKRVNSSGANVVWTAMRAPKQDEFDQRLSAQTPNAVCVGVGRAFRLLTGDVRQAPRWAQKMGVAGIFTRKVSLAKALEWYFETVFFLIGYSVKILWLRLRGRSCNE